MQDDPKTHSCTLCSKPIKSKPVRIEDNSDPLFASYLFDCTECLDMFNRLRAVYGEALRIFSKMNNIFQTRSGTRCFLRNKKY